MTTPSTTCCSTCASHRCVTWPGPCSPRPARRAHAAAARSPGREHLAGRATTTDRLAACQETEPTTLLAYLAGGSSRLGRYYERLWQFLPAGGTGCPVGRRPAGTLTGRQTLGELDLLLRDDQGVHHLELAIKLYLGPEQAAGDDATTGWDRPARIAWASLEHLRRHQLPLASTPAQPPGTGGIDRRSTALGGLAGGLSVLSLGTGLRGPGGQRPGPSARALAASS